MKEQIFICKENGDIIAEIFEKGREWAILRPSEGEYIYRQITAYIGGQNNVIETCELHSGDPYQEAKFLIVEDLRGLYPKGLDERLNFFDTKIVAKKFLRELYIEKTKYKLYEFNKNKWAEVADF